MVYSCFQGEASTKSCEGELRVRQYCHYIWTPISLIQSQLMERGVTVQVLTASERARTVNAKGNYVDNQ